MIEGDKVVHRPTGRKRYLEVDEMHNWTPNNCMKLLTCHFPEAIIEKMTDLVRTGIFPNRSEVQRHAVIRLLQEYNLIP